MTRVRFAPSPTGALHIGGVRTALFNYLFTRKNKGTFILRIEDTDQNRYVENAEEYIAESLKWLGLTIDESPAKGGPFEPYRQSERKSVYQEYIKKLIEKDRAYYAFDTAEELEKLREENPNFRYDASVREKLNNSLNKSAGEVLDLIQSDVPYTIRLKVESEQEVSFDDIIRGHVTFRTNELDDKVLIKADGLPTYHFANVVDDRLMGITHVIRGEEWLSSTAHHVLLYEAFGWEQQVPYFAHLPLILKPTGKGKLSKRDGAKFDMPVFPLKWDDPNPEESFRGFREYGFLPEAVLNFLAFLGWNPGDEREIFSLEELIEVFALEKVSKAGARFDYEKAKWFNQQYIVNADIEKLYETSLQFFTGAGIHRDKSFLMSYIELFRERISLLSELPEAGYYFFRDIEEYDLTTWNKKFKPGSENHILNICTQLEQSDNYTREGIDSLLKRYLADNQSGPGDIFPLLRIGLTGIVKGPDLIDTFLLMGAAFATSRLKKSLNHLKQK